MRFLLLLLLLIGPATAQPVNPQVVATGITTEVCTDASFLVTASSAYTSGNEVGGLITFTPFRTPQTGAAGYSGILQSVRLTSKSVQTATFNVYQFKSNPSATTWADKTTPSINVADVTKLFPPIALGAAYSPFGTHTVYGTDAIAAARVSSSISTYFIITVTGTPTFTATTDLQFCATFLVD